MWRGMIATVLMLTVPSLASAGPLRDAAEKAARELVFVPQVENGGGRGRFWTGIALLGGGSVLAALGGLELGDDQQGPDDGEDADASDDGEDSDGWADKAMLGGGIAAAALGGVFLLTGRRAPGPALSVRPGRITVRHTVGF